MAYLWVQMNTKCLNNLLLPCPRERAWQRRELLTIMLFHAESLSGFRLLHLHVILHSYINHLQSLLNYFCHQRVSHYNSFVTFTFWTSCFCLIISHVTVFCKCHAYTNSYISKTFLVLLLGPALNLLDFHHEAFSNKSVYHIQYMTNNYMLNWSITISAVILLSWIWHQ